MIVENIAADRNGMLYVADRAAGTILRVDPKAPTPVVVARIESREVQGRRVNSDPSGLAFNAQGDLFIATGPFAEVVRVRAADLNPAKPGLAQTWGTGTAGANGIAFDSQGNLFVSGGASGVVFRVAATGGAAQPSVQIESCGLTPMLVGKIEPSNTDRLAIWWCRPRLLTTPRAAFSLIAQPPIRCAVNSVARNFFSDRSAIAFFASAQLEE